MTHALTSLKTHATQKPDAIAIVSGEQQVTYQELSQRVTQLAAWLRDQRISTAAFQLDNGIDWVVADLALLDAGINSVPVPQFFSHAQLLHLIGDARVELFLCKPDLLPEPAWNTISCPGLTAVVAHGIAHPDRCPKKHTRITYTSGSTGTPKGVCLNLDTLDAVSQSIVSVMSPVTAERHLCVLPLATLLENIAGLYAPLIRGIEVHCPSLVELGLTNNGVEVQRFAQTINQVQPHTMILVPQLLMVLVTLAEMNLVNTKSFTMIAVGGGRISPQLLGRARGLGLPVYEGYGLSECASVVTLNLPGQERPGSVGKPLPQAELRVSSQGEIEVRGPVMSGYLGDTPLSSDWYATGDLGHIDEDGYVFISGRIRNVFITAFGRNVSPEWIESSLTQHAPIAHALAFGESMQHNLVLLWLRFPQPEADIERIVSLANTTLPDYARAHAFKIMSGEFPPALLTANGRIKRMDAISHFHSTIMDHYTTKGSNDALLQQTA